MDLSGLHIEEPYTSTFETAPPTIIPPIVVSSNITDGMSNVSPDARIIITFSAPMHIGTVQDAFSILPNAPGLFSWQDGDRIMTYQPVFNLQSGMTFTVKISTIAQDKTWHNLVEPYQFSFTVK